MGKHKFYFNSEYFIIYSMQRAPFIFIKNCYSFITILQSSVVTDKCDHTMKCCFYDVASMIEELGAGQKAVSAWIPT